MADPRFLDIRETDRIVLTLASLEEDGASPIALGEEREGRGRREKEEISKVQGGEREGGEGEQGTRYSSSPVWVSITVAAIPPITQHKELSRK